MKEWIGELFRVLGRNAWISHLWDTCLVASVAIIFLLLIRPLLKRLPRSVAYVLWIVVAAQILCPVSFSGIYRALPKQVSEQVSVGKQTLQMEEIASSLRETKLPAGGQSEQGEVKGEAITSEDKVPQKVQQTETVIRTQETKHTHPTIMAAQGVLGVWVLGMVVCFGMLIVSLVRNKRRFAERQCIYA